MVLEALYEGSRSKLIRFDLGVTPLRPDGAFALPDLLRSRTRRPGRPAPLLSGMGRELRGRDEHGGGILGQQPL